MKSFFHPTILRQKCCIYFCRCLYKVYLLFITCTNRSVFKANALSSTSFYKGPYIGVLTNQFGIAPLQCKSGENTGICCLSQKDICSKPLQSAGWDLHFNMQRTVCGLPKTELEKPTRCSCSSSRGRAFYSSLPDTTSITAPGNMNSFKRAGNAQYSLKQLFQMDAGALEAKRNLVKQAAGETWDKKIPMFALLTVPERLLHLTRLFISPKYWHAAQSHLKLNTLDPNWQHLQVYWWTDTHILKNKQLWKPFVGKAAQVINWKRKTWWEVSFFPRTFPSLSESFSYSHIHLKTISRSHP